MFKSQNFEAAYGEYNKLEEQKEVNLCPIWVVWP